jgi:hypothetical protein
MGGLTVTYTCEDAVKETARTIRDNKAVLLKKFFIMNDLKLLT